jgi:hypothetical protein
VALQLLLLQRVLLVMVCQRRPVGTLRWPMWLLAVRLCWLAMGRMQGRVTALLLLLLLMMMMTTMFEG